jgi:hypothetical protein
MTIELIKKAYGWPPFIPFTISKIATGIAKKVNKINNRPARVRKTGLILVGLSILYRLSYISATLQKDTLFYFLQLQKQFFKLHSMRIPAEVAVGVDHAVAGDY